MVVDSDKFSAGCGDIRRGGGFHNMTRIDSRPMVGFYWVCRPSAVIQNKVLKGPEF